MLEAVIRGSLIKARPIT